MCLSGLNMSKQGKKLSHVLGVDPATGKDKVMLVITDEHGNLTFTGLPPAGSVFVYDESLVGRTGSSTGTHGFGV